MRKWLVVFLTVVVALGLGAYFSMGYFAKQAIERVGSRLLLTQVEVGTVIISPLSGSLVISELKVYNPEGFSQPIAVQIPKIEVRASYGELRANPMVVDSILIEAPVMYFETGFTGNNIFTLKRNASYSDKSNAEVTSHEQKQAVIGNLAISQPKLLLVAPSAAPGAEAYELPMSDIVMTDIGRTQPASLAAVLEHVLGRVLTAIPLIDSTAQEGLQGLRSIMDGARQGVRDLIDRP